MSRLADFVAYIAIGLSAVLVAIFLAESGLNETEVVTAINWARVGAYSAIVFLGIAFTRKPFLRNPRFWLIWSLLLCIHTVGWSFFLARVSEWSVLVSMMICFAEYLIADTVLRGRGYPAYRRANTDGSPR